MCFAFPLRVSSFVSSPPRALLARCSTLANGSKLHSSHMDSIAAGERTGREGTERPEPSSGGVGEDPPPASLAFVDALPTVLLHGDWIARGAAPAVCREWARPLHGDAHWRWLCERVALERGLYLPAGSCPSPKGWRAHFTELDLPFISPHISPISPLYLQVGGRTSPSCGSGATCGHPLRSAQLTLTLTLTLTPTLTLTLA